MEASRPTDRRPAGGDNCLSGGNREINGSINDFNSSQCGDTSRHVTPRALFQQLLIHEQQHSRGKVANLAIMETKVQKIRLHVSSGSGDSTHEPHYHAADTQQTRALCLCHI